MSRAKTVETTKIECNIIHETANAILIEPIDFISGGEVWIPLSQVSKIFRPERHSHENASIYVASWLAKSKGWID